MILKKCFYSYTQGSCEFKPWYKISYVKKSGNAVIISRTLTRNCLFSEEYTLSDQCYLTLVDSISLPFHMIAPRPNLHRRGFLFLKIRYRCFGPPTVLNNKTPHHNPYRNPIQACKHVPNEHWEGAYPKSAARLK